MSFMMMSSLLNQLNKNETAASGEWKVYSPSITGKLIGVCQYRFSDLDLAATGAKSECEKLSRMVHQDRIKLTNLARETLFTHQREIFEIAQFELGRSSADLQVEWEEMERFLHHLQNGTSFNSASPESESRGVVAVLGSSVWPIFYSIQLTFLNFLAGNAVILKPSERCSLTVLKIFEVLRSELPEFRAIQVLLGEREVGRRLACHESIAAVIFQGSFEVGMRVRQDTLSQPAKEIFLFLGAKNPSIVFRDAPESVYETLIADAFQGAGQDCQSAALIFVERQFFEAFTEQFHQRSKEFKIGSPEEDAFMGPLIDAAIMDRYFKFIGISEREGAQILMRGKPLKRPEGGFFVTPTLASFSEITPDQLRKSVSLQTEILSPHVSLIGFKDEVELLSLLNALNHGKMASIWTTDTKRATSLARMIDCGHVKINQSLKTRGLVNYQARRRSGNHAICGPDLVDQLRLKKWVD